MIRVFSNGPGRAGKKRNEILSVGPGYKKKENVLRDVLQNIASQSGPTKQTRSFETGG